MHARHHLGRLEFSEVSCCLCLAPRERRLQPIHLQLQRASLQHQNFPLSLSPSKPQATASVQHNRCRSPLWKLRPAVCLVQISILQMIRHVLDIRQGVCGSSAGVGRLQIPAAHLDRVRVVSGLAQRLRLGQHGLEALQHLARGVTLGHSVLPSFLRGSRLRPGCLQCSLQRSRVSCGQLPLLAIPALASANEHPLSYTGKTTSLQSQHYYGIKRTSVNMRRRQQFFPQTPE